MKPCLDCGTLSDRNRCLDHRRERRQQKELRHVEIHGERRQRAEGHSETAWIKLSRRARSLQEFCIDCRRTAQELAAVGERLEADHLPSAWFKYYRRQPMTLADVEITCGACNRARGSSRPGTPRYEEWEKQNGITGIGSIESRHTGISTTTKEPRL